jgi:hypothetical protein
MVRGRKGRGGGQVGTGTLRHIARSELGLGIRKPGRKVSAGENELRWSRESPRYEYIIDDELVNVWFHMGEDYFGESRALVGLESRP